MIHFSEVLKQMNFAMKHHQQVSFKAYKLGRDDKDPERGMIKSYDRVYVTSHSRFGSFNIQDPLSNSERDKFRHVNEALICSFMGKEVIW